MAYTTTKEVSMALLSLEQAEFKIKREAGLMKKKYPRQYHAHPFLAYRACTTTRKRGGARCL
jgi:hypothetical protein